MIFNSYDEYDILNQPITEEVEREIINVKDIEPFTSEWNDITNNASMDNLKNYLMKNFDLKNPCLNEKAYKKKYPNLKNARKLRWNRKNNQQSQNGDMRVIDAYIHEKKSVYLIYCYPKNKQEDITPLQAKIISNTLNILKNMED